MTTTTYYNLNIAEGTDIVNPLTVDNPNYEKIDEVMHDNAVAGVTLATELTNATIHALTRENSDCSVIRFIATSQWKAGDSVTVDGVPVLALLPTGETLPDGAYVINANVLCVLTGTNLTVYASKNAANASEIPYNDTNVKTELDNLNVSLQETNTSLQETKTSLQETKTSLQEINSNLTVDVTNLSEDYTLNGLLQMLAEKYFPNIGKIDVSGTWVGGKTLTLSSPSGTKILGFDITATGRGTMHVTNKVNGQWTNSVLVNDANYTNCGIIDNTLTIQRQLDASGYDYTYVGTVYYTT